MRQISAAVLAKARVAHEAIHNPEQDHVTIEGRTYPIVVYRNGCRCVDIGGYTVMEQNKKKTTTFSKRAANGEHLSWVIPLDPNVAWHLLENVSE